MKQIYFTFALVIIALFNSCKDESNNCPEPPKPFELEINEFWIDDAGENVGYCGWVLQGWDKERKNLLTFKPVNIPWEIREEPFRLLKGKLEILPELYSCKDGRPDPLPGKDHSKISINFVNILEWSVK